MYSIWFIKALHLSFRSHQNINTSGLLVQRVFCCRMLPCFLLSNSSFAINRNLFWWHGGGKDQFKLYKILLLLFLFQSKVNSDNVVPRPLVKELFLAVTTFSVFSSSKVTVPWGDLSDLAIISITGGLAESSRSSCFLALFLFSSSRDVILAEGLRHSWG